MAQEAQHQVDLNLLLQIIGAKEYEINVLTRRLQEALNGSTQRAQDEQKGQAPKPAEG